jgi:hypothetical protein
MRKRHALYNLVNKAGKIKDLFRYDTLSLSYNSMERAEVTLVVIRPAFEIL